MRIVFSYDKDNRPRAEVTLYNNEKEVELAPIIDSGADITVIPKGIGEELGLSFPEEEELNNFRENKLSSAEGNLMDYVIRTIKIKIGEFNFEIDVCWLFNNKGAHFLLGRNIFDKFDILFKQNPYRKIIFESDKEVFN